MFDTAIYILNKLYENNYDAYIIGGYPRDLILNINNDDIDICTNAKPDIIKSMFEVVEDNSQFGSLRIKYNNYIFEITTFRIDLEYNGRYPKIEYTNSLEEDLKRRDFTINTICIDKDKNYIDLYHGIDDINNKIIKCIGDLDVKLKEDPIRILRAIRFAGKLNFTLDNELKESIIKYRYLVNTLSKNKINSELSKMNEKSLNMIKELNIKELL